MMDPTSDGIVRLDRSFGQQAVETLVRAFRDHQPLQYYFPERTKQERIAPYLMSMAVYPGLRYGEVHATSPTTAGTVEGIAIWMPSDNYPVAPWRLLRTVPFAVFLAFARYGGYRLKGLGQYIDTVHSRLAPFRHMYLQSLGVDPNFQGKGYAGKLLRHMLTRMDAEGMPCFLETAEEQNVGLYEHFGFAVVDESTVPGTSLTNWAMLRKA